MLETAFGACPFGVHCPREQQSSSPRSLLLHEAYRTYLDCCVNSSIRSGFASCEGAEEVVLMEYSSAPGAAQGREDVGEPSSSGQEVLMPPQRRNWKRCASHVYIAHFIEYKMHKDRCATYAVISLPTSASVGRADKANISAVPGRA